MTQPRTRREPTRRYGRPTVLTPATQAAYLDLLRHGLRLGEAAEVLGINRAVPTRHSKVDKKFAAAVTKAREVGKAVREAGIPHDEYRYNILKCRCPQCTTAATEGRAERRAVESPPGADEAQVHPIRPPVGESLTSFLLARAS
ncbi:hypothetical protein [Streptomyces sp. NBC_01422]|uniref:hypothetical protein n=1 Tax=Streptomyces sp. NBC_01422 TaxID=2903859 RepID=UPI002E2A5BE9|nr:hypothetical protein [Streptomyces sp. NBC_01422]